ncbi:MAG: TonB-dependent receptor [Proteobacteria bacterium]|nr:TonB-dependent receptor [Pseudomonadota bacterium]
MTDSPHTPSAVALMVGRQLRPLAVTFAAALLLPFPGLATAADSVPQGAAVTGTHIRGTNDSAFPIWIYNRDVIEASGAGTLQQFIQMLPQNFNGGASENTVQSVAGGGNAANTVQGTGVNLRGLGNDATLVLVNGHRVAPGNVSGNFVDLSLIPLYAVERVEVVTDGASAIYGSDAVGGVVNIILGRNLDGAESRVRYGRVTSGSTSETEVGQTLGGGWDTGSALLIYDYWDRTPLDASSREYTRSAPEPFMLLPQQVRHSAFFSVDDSITPSIQLFAEGNYSHRSTVTASASAQAQLRTSSIIDGFSGSGGGRFELPRGAQLELSGSYAGSITRYGSDLEGVGSLANERVDSGILSFDAKVDGSVISIPAGDVRFAVGGQFRRESFDSRNVLATTEFYPHRNVGAGFVELRVPLIGGRNSLPGIDLLELTLADRAEHYSDFGSTNNPQVGLIWRPVADVKLRGTYGTSFRAPLLNDLNPIPFQVVPIPEFDPASGDLTNALAVFGGNAHLSPEKAHTWTAGLDFSPQSLPEFHAGVTYYNIRFSDVVTDPEFSVDILNALSQEAILGPAIIQRNPSAALVQQLAAGPGFTNLFDIDLATIGAIVDLRVHNLSIQKTSGLDLDAAWARLTGIGNLEIGLNGNYIFGFENQFTAEAPTVSILNTAYNPVNLRMRARGVLRRGGLTLATFVNYTNSYRVGVGADSASVASWTTVDATVKYLFNADGGPLADLALLVAITNLADRHPPEVLNSVGINFDGANANALGRMLSVQLSKRW